MHTMTKAKAIPANIEIETVKNCPVCGFTEFTKLASKGIIQKGGDPYAMNNVMCLRCSCVFLNPRPTEKGYEEFYRTLYVSDRGEVEKEGGEIEMTKDVSVKQSSIADALEPHIAQGARMLVVGGGLGIGSSFLRDHFKANLEMLEPSEEQAVFAQQKYGLHVHNMDWHTFTKTHEPVAQYNAIILHHVLEHFPQPATMLTKARPYLNKSGVIYIEVPDVNGYKKPKNHFFDLLHPISFSDVSLFWTLQFAGLKAIWKNDNKPTRLQIIAQLSETAGEKESVLRSSAWSTTKTFCYSGYRTLYDTAYRLRHG